MKTLISFILLLFFISCENEKPEKKLSSPTEKILTKHINEKNAAQVVVDFYGGEIEVSPGVLMNEGKKEKFIQIELKRSELAESYSAMINIPASNIAYLFYNGLQSKAIDYDYIKVLISLNDGSQNMFQFYISEINDLEYFVEILNKVSQLLKSKNTSVLRSLFAPEVTEELNESTLNKYINHQDSIYGTINETQFQGFSILQTEDDNQFIIQLYGIMIRSKENTPICVFIDRNTKDILTIEDSF